MEPKAFGPFVFDRSTATLRKDGKPVALGGRGGALLRALVEADGAVVGKEALLTAAWPGLFVEESNLPVQIGVLRKALGTQQDGSEWIITVPRVGYQLAPPHEEGLLSGRPSIAVLPFANLGSDPEQGHFADGLVDELITALSQFKSFAVAARTSSFVYKTRSADARDIARELGVRYLLEGSVRRSGDRLRIVAQLIEGASGAHLWAQKFEGAGTDLFDFQDAITRAAVSLIEPQIRRAEIERSRRKRPESLDAWDLYIRALPLVYAPDADGYDEAIAMLDRAIELDADYVPALALAAWAREKRVQVTASTPEGIDDRGDALALAERAYAIDPGDPMAMGLLGWLKVTFDRDASGVDLCRRAAGLNPNSLFVLNFATVAHLNAGSPEEGLASATRAFELSRHSSDAYVCMHDIACAHLKAGRYEEALVWARRSVAANAGYLFGHLDVAASATILGLTEEAREAAARAMTIRPELTLRRLAGADPAHDPAAWKRWFQPLHAVGIPKG